MELYNNICIHLFVKYIYETESLGHIDCVYFGYT